MLAQGTRPGYEAGTCEVDLGRRELRISGASVPIGGRAFEIIETLAQSAGELVTKDELINRVWPGAVVLENTLQVHIAAVRKALGSQRGMLKTETGRGYRLLGSWTIRAYRAGAARTTSQSLQAYQGALPTNLPATVASIVGRSQAVQRLRDLVSAYRVVTLTGPGGIGKTTLAIEVARGLFGEFDDGIWLVELASLSDPAFVPSAAARVLGLGLVGDQVSAEALARAVGGTNRLLLLDNCEHVIDTAAELAGTIVRLCPRTTVLATSREALRIAGEYIYRVPPLDVPAPESAEADRILGHSAVELFMARAGAMDVGPSQEAEDLALIATICRRLDGIPLAIEFAAARAATLGILGVAAGLENRFELLTGGRRTALPRHQTLRAVLDWSYDLLPDEEQRLLSHLSIFIAGFTLEAATAVGVVDGAAKVVDGISSLFAKSLLNRDASAAMPRWRLLETTRAYALEKLSKGGERSAAARRHAEYFHDLIVPTTANPVLRLTIQDVTRQGQELDNVRAALDWAFSPGGDTAIGVGLTAAFAPVWVHLSLMVECRERAEQALQHPSPDHDLATALERRLLMALGVALTVTLGPVERTRSVIARARQLAEGITDREVQLRMLWAQWSMELTAGQYRNGLATAEQFRQLASDTGDHTLVLVGDGFFGTALAYAGQLRQARDCLERVVRRYVAPPNGHHAILFHNDQRMIARAALARVLFLQGCIDQARELARQLLEEALTADALTLGRVLHEGVCPVALMVGDTPTAERAVTALNDLAMRSDAALWKLVGACWEGKLLIERQEFARATDFLSGALRLCDQSAWQIGNAGFLGYLAEALAGLGEHGEALRAINQGLARADTSGELQYQAELIRIKGEVLLRGDPGQAEFSAEEHFRRSGEMARGQGALFWVLRAAVSFARLRMTQGRRDEAKQVLAPVLAQFTEGFGTPDLRAAKTLLDEL